SMVAIGPLPPAGQWARLEVPAAAVGLERDTVTALAFTLFGGEAWWDLSGKTSGTGLAAENGYAGAAYQALLTGVGTSWEELRTARGAAPAARAALAARLGIPLSSSRPDQLDQLLLPPATVTEADLEQLFGMAPTDTDALSGLAGTPQLLDWQQQSLYAPWAAQDHATVDPHDYTAPVIDPDIVTLGDFRDTTTPAGQAAFGLWQARAKWVTTQMSTLAGAQSAGLSALLSQQLAGFDLSGTAAAEARARTSPQRWLPCPLTTPASNGSSRCPHFLALARLPTTNGLTRWAWWCRFSRSGTSRPGEAAKRMPCPAWASSWTPPSFQFRPSTPPP